MSRHRSTIVIGFLILIIYVLWLKPGVQAESQPRDTTELRSTDCCYPSPYALPETVNACSVDKAAIAHQGESTMH